MEQSKKNVPFFIIGSERSGTTLLRVMLDAHPRLHIPRESHFITELLKFYLPEKPLRGNEIFDAFELVRSQKRWREWNVDDEVIVDKLKRFDSLTLADFIDLLFTHVTCLENKVRWGDKTPSYVLIIDKIKRLFPDAKFIHVVRDGRDVCLSLLDRGWHGEWLRSIAERWAWTVTTGRQLGTQIGSDSYIEIKYEDLVTDSKSVLHQLCDFLNERYSETMLSFYERSNGKVADREAHVHRKLTRKPNLGDIDRWTREMSLIQVITVESVAGFAMDMFDQKRKFTGILQLIPAIFRLCFSLAERSLPIRKRLGIHFPGLKGKL